MNMNFSKKNLGPQGYDSHFQNRPSKKDGCGIFFKRNKFDLVSSYFVDYNDGTSRIATIVQLRHVKNERHIDIENSTKMLHEHVVVKENSDEQHIVTESTEKFIIVGTTHLFWDNKKEEIQIKEIQLFLESLQKFNPNNFPTIICGDFNSYPTQSIYRIMNLNKFQSAYQNYKNTGQHPPFTSYKSFASAKCIDYIFYKTDTTPRVIPTHVLDLQEQQFSEKVETFIPNSAHPSDHLPIMATFEVQ